MTTSIISLRPVTAAAAGDPLARAGALYAARGYAASPRKLMSKRL